MHNAIENKNSLEVYQSGLSSMKEFGQSLDGNSREEALHCFCNYIQERTGQPLIEKDRKVIGEAHRVKLVRRRQYLLQEGDVCNNIAFVVKGAMRMYAVSERGEEIILSLGIENCWMGDRESMAVQAPSPYNIEAVENTVVIQFTIQQLNMLCENVAVFEQMMRIQNRELSIATQKRIHAALSMTADEKYHDFLEYNAAYAQRFTQNMIASYLGIKPATLSRMRKRLNSKGVKKMGANDYPSIQQERTYGEGAAYNKIFVSNAG